MKKQIFVLAALLTASVMSVNAQDPQTTAHCGDVVTITATPDAGYKFLYWDDDHSLTNATRQVEIDENTTIYDYKAVFGVATYAVTVTTDQTDMGTVSGGGDYEFGTSATLTATANNKCYKFVKWSDGNTANPRTVTVSSDETANVYKAEFAYEDFTVKVTSGGNGSVTISKE